MTQNMGYDVRTNYLKASSSSEWTEGSWTIECRALNSVQRNSVSETDISPRSCKFIIGQSRGGQINLIRFVIQ
jgi:hypothetical protein